MLYNAYATVVALPSLGFAHTVRSQRDLRNPELAAHLQGFIGFVMGGGSRQMNAVRYAPDGSVLDASGAVLCAPGSGDAATGTRAPYPAEAEARKARSEAELATRGVRVVASLPPVVGEGEVVLHSAEAVLARAQALFICALRAESLGGGKGIPAAELRARFTLGAAALSPNEQAFLDSAQPDRQSITNHAWGYEALAVLVWALGAFPLPFPAAIVDVPGLAGLLLNAQAAPWLNHPALRPAAEVLDALDLHFRLHWHTTQARLGRAKLVGIEAGVVMERHRALNWLTGFEGAEWDDVETPT